MWGGFHIYSYKDTLSILKVCSHAFMCVLDKMDFSVNFTILHATTSHDVCSPINHIILQNMRVQSYSKWGGAHNKWIIIIHFITSVRFRRFMTTLKFTWFIINKHMPKHTNTGSFSIDLLSKSYTSNSGVFYSPLKSKGPPQLEDWSPTLAWNSHVLYILVLSVQDGNCSKHIRPYVWKDKHVNFVVRDDLITTALYNTPIKQAGRFWLAFTCQLYELWWGYQVQLSDM